jgi:hypothetical protein
MSILANLTPEQIDLIKKLVRHMDRGILSHADCVGAIVADLSVTPTVAEDVLNEVKRAKSSRS